MIAQKYINVQKGIGGMMLELLIETEARNILNKGIQQGVSRASAKFKKRLPLG